MTLHLVSEARPIPWKDLTELEKKELNAANGWINAVVVKAKVEEAVANGIDRQRTGRVLFIDGKRGTGKTSLLLTLLDLWGKDQERPAPEDKEGPDPRPRVSCLHVLSPVLDFDPLPRGMPLHGWLLEPWREVAKKLEKEGGFDGNSRDLSEQWADLFERVVLGWTQAMVEGKGVVEKALAYQEQASGWIDTRKLWHEFVNAVVCRKSRCSRENCKGAHSTVFVVAIDDVDLQVEQVPRLLHAIRLLHHPNVVYVLTGNYKHLKFVLELDYVGRHEHLVPTHRYGREPVGDDQWEEIKEHSERLSAALLQKAIPSHAMLTLKTLSLKEVLAMPDVTGLSEEWSEVARIAGALPIVTARQAQHAIDRHLGRSKEPVGSPSKSGPERAAQFVADLCGTDIKLPRQFMLRGRLTTRFGAVFQAWEGDRLKIMLMETPSFVFHSEFDEDHPLLDDEANRAVIVQLAVEKKLASASEPAQSQDVENGLVEALGLAWMPDAGVVATEVRWSSQVTNIQGRAVFRWPWLVRPTVSEVLALRDVAQQMSKAANDISLTRLNEKMLVVWLSKNLEWQYARKELRNKGGGEEKPRNSLEEIAKRLKELCQHDDDKIKEEVIRWVGEIMVMTAPYFGLPATVAKAIRTALWCSELVPSASGVTVEQTRMVEDAIILGQLRFEPVGHRSRERRDGPTSTDFDKAVKDFLKQRGRVKLPNRTPKTKSPHKNTQPKKLASSSQAKK